VSEKTRDGVLRGATPAVPLAVTAMSASDVIASARAIVQAPLLIEARNTDDIDAIASFYAEDMS
jgi:hypothetical protein